MQEFLKADIFFFVTTVVVVLVGIGLVVALIYIIRILKDMTSLSRKAKEEGERIIDDVSFMRQQAKNQGSGLINLVSTFFKFTRGGNRASKKKDTEV